MSAFGTLLRRFRKQAVAGKLSGGKTLTQKDLAEQLNLVAGLRYSHAAISNWERGVNGIDPRDRSVVTSLVKTLVVCRGITELAEAQRLLRAGQHDPLTKAEIRRIKQSWLLSETDEEMSEDMPFEHANEVVDSAELIGRVNDVHTLLSHLTDRRKSPVTLLSGIVGVGKTVVANEVCRLAREGLHFASTILVDLSAQELMSAEEAYDYFLAEIAAQVLGEEQEVGGAHAVWQQQLVDALSKKALLIVADGLASDAATDHFCTSLDRLAQASSSRYLIVSRARAHCRDAQSYTLQPLQFEAAMRLLERYSDERSLDVAENLDLIERIQLYQSIGGVPMAIELTTSLLSTGLQLDDVLAAIRDNDEEDERGIVKLQTIYAQIFGRLSPTSLRLLTSFLFASHAGTNRETLQAISALEGKAWRRAYSPLEQQALILHQQGDDSYATHNLTAHMLLSELNPLLPQPEFIQLVERALTYWLAEFGDDEYRFGLLDSQRQNWWRTIDTLLQQPDVARLLRPKVFAMAHKLYQFVQRRGFWLEWMPLLDKLVAEQIFDVSAELCHLRCQLGVLYLRHNNDDQAQTCFESANRDAMSLGDAESIGRSLLHLAENYLAVGDWPKAESQASQAERYFEQCRFIQGIVAVNNLRGQVALGRGKWEVAETHFQTALDQINILRDPTEAARTLHNLGIAQLRRDAVADAQATFAKAAGHLLPVRNAHKPLATLNIIYLAQCALGLGYLEEADAQLRSIDTDWIDQHDQTGLLARYHRVSAALEFARDNLRAATYAINASYKLWDPQHYTRQIAHTLYLKVRIELATKEYTQARQSYREALDLILSQSRYGDMQLLHEQLRTLLPLFNHPL